MEYRINEGVLTLPEQFEDSSVNILKLHQQQATLVITRTMMESGQTLDAYFAAQIAQLKQTMQSFAISEKKSITLSGCAGLTAYEASCELEQQGQKLNQILLMLVHQQQLMIFTYSQPRPLSEADWQYWEGVKANIQLQF